ncbi:MAG: nucleotidyltransferase domain-containing protein [Anaerolineae bacterium]|nr:nucleotidyltransferase domain-containing protein [Anaerolineae bacterium]
MQPKFDVATVLPNLIAWCETRAVRLCVLFGSQATGMAHPRSDVDLAGQTAKATAPDYLRWLRELETMLGREVNLVIVSADLDPVLGMEIVRHGQLLYERESGLWSHHRLQLWHAYNDSLPFLRRARQSLREFAEEVRVRLDDEDAA